jgi:predicted kinase
MTTQAKTVVLVNGVPASGKSTVTRQLSARFSLPVLTIDGIKEPFMAKFAQIDRAFNRQLGYAAYDVIWSIIRNAPPGCPFLVDAWFGFQPRETLIDYLEKAGVTRVLEVWNAVSPEVAVARYASRLGERRMGHPGEEYLPELAVLAAKAEPMAIGPVFRVEQGGEIAFAPLNAWIEEQLYT